MNITCKNCHTSVSAADINLDNLLAKCRSCDAVFDISEQVGRSAGAADTSAKPSGKKRPRAAVPLPKGIKVLRGGREVDPSGDPYRSAGSGRGGRLEIHRRWFSFVFIFLLFFCIAWDSFLIFWYAMAGGTGQWLMVVFPILHVAVGVGLTYYTIAGFFNTTRVVADGQMLTIRHGPLPWRGNRDIPLRELKQLYVQRKITRNKNGSTETFNLCAVVRDKRKLTLVSGMPEADQALFMEQQLEQHLGIVDVAVGDEYDQRSV